MREPDVPRVRDSFRGMVITIAVILGWSVISLFVFTLRDDPLDPVTGNLIRVVIAVAVAYFIVRTMSALGYGVPLIVLAVIGMAIPLVNLFVLLRINTQATRVLRDAGYEVGFLGPRR